MFVPKEFRHPFLTPFLACQGASHPLKRCACNVFKAFYKMLKSLKALLLRRTLYDLTALGNSPNNVQ